MSGMSCRLGSLERSYTKSFHEKSQFLYQIC